MINAQELRIGNWVNLYGKVPKQVTYIGIDLLEVGSANGLHKYDKIEPISLTPEILERCGFEKKELPFNMCAGQGGFEICVQPSANRFLLIIGDVRIKQSWLYNSSDIYRGQPLGFIYHLHQLQNLFFELTGTELNIDPQ